MNIPIHTSTRRNFTIPVFLNYASRGYKPNVQTGILGAERDLSAGGVITREVNGIPDESVKEYTYKDKFAGGESDHGNADADKHIREMSGYYQFFINPSLPSKCRKDYLYFGVPGQEYVITYPYDPSGPDTRYYETEPDLFRYDFMGFGVHSCCSPVKSSYSTAIPLPANCGSNSRAGKYYPTASEIR